MPFDSCVIVLLDSQSFDDAVKFVRDGPKPSSAVPNERKLKVYGLFKQSTEGDVSTDRPGGMFNWEAQAKWDAWNSNKGKSKEVAQAEYIEEVKAQAAEFY